MPQAIKILNMIKVFGKPIRVNKASQDKKTQDVGANLFIGNIDPDVDEKVLAHSSMCCIHAEESLCMPLIRLQGQCRATKWLRVCVVHLCYFLWVSDQD